MSPKIQESIYVNTLFNIHESVSAEYVADTEESVSVRCLTSRNLFLLNMLLNIQESVSVRCRLTSRNLFLLNTSLNIQESVSVEYVA